MCLVLHGGRRQNTLGVLVLGRLLCSRSARVAVRPAPVASCSGGDHTHTAFPFRTLASFELAGAAACLQPLKPSQGAESTGGHSACWPQPCKAFIARSDLLRSPRSAAADTAVLCHLGSSSLKIQKPSFPKSPSTPTSPQHALRRDSLRNPSAG